MVENPENHVDVEQLSELKDIMEDEFHTLIDTFLSDSSSKIEGLAAAIGAADAEEVRKLAHSLKGSSSNICASQLTEYARQLEHMGKEGSTEGAQDVFEKLKMEFDEVAVILKNEI